VLTQWVLKTTTAKEIDMAMKEDYIKKMKSKLEEWDNEMRKLADRDIKLDMKKEYQEQVEALKPKMAAARKKMDDLEKASENAWEDLKAGMDMAWNAIAETIQAIKSRFK